MTFQWAGGAVNVQGSFNRFFRQNITAAGLPLGMTGITAYFDYPDQGLTAFPAYTVMHLPSNDIHEFQGNFVQGSPSAMQGARVYGSVEISCWVNIRESGGGRNNSAMIQLRAMRDMVKYMFNSAHHTPILNIYASTGNPVSTSALLRWHDFNESQVIADDPNPNVRRIRLVLDYDYLEKQSA